VLFFFLKKREQNIRDIAFYTKLFNIYALSKQVSAQPGSGDNIKLLKIVCSKVFEFFFEDNLELVICDILVVI
jgi:hypothetical protein